MENPHTKLSADPPADIPARVVGIGSPHGDDQAGWRVVDRIAELLPASLRVELHQLRTPTELLDLLHPHSATWITDACHYDTTNSPAYQRLTWPHADLVALPLRSSHHLSVAAALELAQTLGRLPSPLVIYAIPGGNWSPNHVLGAEIAQRCELAAQAILGELQQYFAELPQSGLPLSKDV